MKPVRRYALGTDVPVSKTRGEIEALLRKHGADQILSGIDHVRRAGFVGFTLAGRQFRIVITHQPDRNRDDEQVERERWRGLLLLIKGKLEHCAGGFISIEQEFLAHVVLPDGTTVGESIAPRLAEAYATGQVQRLLPA